MTDPFNASLVPGNDHLNTICKQASGDSRELVAMTPLQQFYET